MTALSTCSTTSRSYTGAVMGGVRLRGRLWR